MVVTPPSCTTSDTDCSCTARQMMVGPRLATTANETTRATIDKWKKKVAAVNSDPDKLVAMRRRQVYDKAGTFK